MVQFFDRARKRVVSGAKLRVNKSLDVDEVTSRPGGFVDDDDSCSVVADREDIVGPTKLGRRSATVRTSAVLLVFGRTLTSRCSH